VCGGQQEIYLGVDYDAGTLRASVLFCGPCLAGITDQVPTVRALVNYGLDALEELANGGRR
jgi:hypothetical protein